MTFKVKALYEYNSGHDDDLAFEIGQIITITDEEDADWYGGEYIDEAGNKQEGIFPRNFVEKFEPAAPPRPTRPRSKKGPEQAAPETSSAQPPPIPAPDSPKQTAPEPEPVRAPSPDQTVSAPPPAPEAAPEPPVPKPVQPVQAPAPAVAPAPPVPQPVEAPAAKSPPAPKPAPVASKPSGPPPVAEKPSGNSFKDRIAAFNKASAAPVTPFKPSGLSAGGGSTFIKKPFVAPPPSRNAYIPPVNQAPVAKIYRRDEDPDVKEQEAEVLENAGKAGLVPSSSTNEGEEADDQPKPLSLKERLALLQKQQMETAARHAEAAAKKEKPKKPPVRKRLDSHDAAAEGEAVAPPLERRDTEDAHGRSSLDESHPPRVPHPNRRRSSKGVEPNDGNEADLSGAGETTEGQEDLTEKEEDNKVKHVATAQKQEEDNEEADEEEDEEEEEEDIDPEVRRKEELRARMAKMSGGMGMPGMGIPGLFGAPAPILPKKKKAAPERRSEDHEEPSSPTARAPPVPMPGIPLPGLSRPPPPPEPKRSETVEEEEEEQDEDALKTPHQEVARPHTPKEQAVPPPVPGGRPAPPPVPSDSRPPPPPPSASAIKSASEGSVSDDELSERPNDESDTPKLADVAAQATRAPPPPPPVQPPTSPRVSQARRQSYFDDSSPTSPNRRESRLPPPIPGSAPALPAQTRPPPPPPPNAAPPLRRESTADNRPPPIPGAPPKQDESDEEEEEITEYEGDYDTDIASSVPHKDALKAHQRDSSFEETVASPRSPITEAPPLPPTAAPRSGPPPIPSQPPPETHARKSVDAPRAAPPPPPPPAKESQYDDDDYDPFNYSASTQNASAIPTFPLPSPRLKQHEEPAYAPETPAHTAPAPPPPQNPRTAPPPPPSTSRPPPSRQSMDNQRGGGRRSADVTRPSMESGFVANDIDLASQSGWWMQPSGLPAQLHGRKDIFFESEESSSADPTQGKTIITRDIYVLFQDYSQTIITVRFNPQDSSDVQLDQRHEPPPRALRQDQLEQSYERFGRAIGEAVAKLKDTVVGDGTSQALIFDLLRPHKDALLPVGTRAYGALVYSNLANASTSQNDEIRPGDIVSIRNAKFQGKHGAMHAKYSVEVGKPDHVAVVAEWDGTKKKVRAWEQGRESKKVKLESFKLDDLRSGEVKIWRVMPRSWVGWEGNNGGGAGGSGN
ncbi:hypothetical protein QBC44DRAFT_34879 [Cladorrhinum sp. PSN332]|nr:hypothetical protein QBC44DRAFT_34879 [Cladorrhinum sp. PSN332]